MRYLILCLMLAGCDSNEPRYIAYSCDTSGCKKLMDFDTYMTCLTFIRDLANVSQAPEGSSNNSIIYCKDNR